MIRRKLVRDHTRAAIREINLIKKMELRKKDWGGNKMNIKLVIPKYSSAFSLRESHKIYFLTDTGNIFSYPDYNACIDEDGNVEFVYATYDNSGDKDSFEVDKAGKLIAISNDKEELEKYFKENK